MLQFINGRDIRDAVYVVGDIERTGSDFHDDQPIEAGEVFCDKNGLILATHTQLFMPVNTGRNPEDITGWIKGHGITPEMVLGQPTFAEYAHEYAELLNGLIYVGLGNSKDFISLKRYFLDSKILFKPGGNIDLVSIIGYKEFDSYQPDLEKILAANTQEHRALPDALTYAACLPLVLDFFEKFPHRKPDISPCSILPFKGLGLV